MIRIYNSFNINFLHIEYLLGIFNYFKEAERCKKTH